VLFHQLHVLEHCFSVDGAAGFWVELVSIDSLEEDTATVDTQEPILDLDASETDFKEFWFAWSLQQALVKRQRFG
jgi:hypothetical protein